MNVDQNYQVREKVRDSNIELYRCIVMLLIVAHHYMIHSGLLNETTNCLTSSESIYLYLFGMWGKIGINCFVLITGYFMCQSDISLRKFLKLLLQVEFYKIFIFIAFHVNTPSMSLDYIILSLLPFTNIDNGFVDCFFVFYLFIPFLNLLVHSMTRNQHIQLISLCLFVFCLWPQLKIFFVSNNYVVWFCVIYIIAAYIRIYGLCNAISCYSWGLITLLMVGLAFLSIVILLNLGRSWPYAFVHDCNAILAVAISICSFMFFKGLNIRRSKFINLAGATTFGVLLIHDCNWEMRRWLWGDLCNCVEWFHKNVYLHSIVCVIGIYTICSIIDYFRLQLFERPLFKLFKKYCIC